MDATKVETAEQVGRRIGRAMARDVIADGMPRSWGGLDAQDADQIPDGMDHDEVEKEARAEYENAIRPYAACAVTVYVVRDAGGEYVKDEAGERRTPAANEAFEFETRDEAEAACTRRTDRVFVRDVHEEG